jgi:transcriptional regulator NrdR family protein
MSNPYESQRRNAGVPCPECGGTVSAVTDSRPTKGRFAALAGMDTTIRRARWCECGARYATVEMPVSVLSGLADSLRRQSLAAIYRAAAAELEYEDMPNAD